MNLAGYLGFIFGGLVIYFSIHGATKDPRLFLDKHAFVIVVGGTLTVAFISFSFKKLYAGFKVVIRKSLGGEKSDYLGVIKTIVEISDVYRQDPKKVLGMLTPKTHPFLIDGIRLLIDFGFPSEDLDKILSNSVKGKRRRDSEETKVWHTISRFPPAFGLLGATLGMIALLQTLGEPGSQDKVGPAMSVALVATFYGLVVANIFFIPIAEKLQDVSQADIVLRSIIKEGVILIAEKKHPTFIEEYLKSFLSPSQRKIEILNKITNKNDKK